MNIPHRVQPGSGSFDLRLCHPTPPVGRPRHRRLSFKPFIASLLLLWASVLGPAVVAKGQAIEDLSNLSLEDLMNIEVTTVGRRPQPLSEAAAAAYVITSDEIRRSGATSVPDALRMVPGLQIAKLDANKWAISARGFNGRFANKLLVLIDGRTVYTPLFSGVYWDAQDILLEDVDRIEVIRGPGATLWGTNAVNGVINIITKAASESQGVLVPAAVRKNADSSQPDTAAAITTSTTVCTPSISNATMARPPSGCLASTTGDSQKAAFGSTGTAAPQIR